MSVVVLQQLHADGLGPWRDRSSLAWSLGTAGVVITSVLIPLVAGAAPLVVLIIGFLVTGALGLPLAFTLALTSLTYLLGIGGVGLIILPDQDPRRRRLVRAARDPAVHPGRRADGVGRDLGTHRGPGDGHRREGPRRPGDGGGRRGDPLLGHLRVDGGRRLGDQLAPRPVDEEGRLFRTRVGQRRRGGIGDGHPRAAVPDDGGARIARELVDRDALPGGVRASVHPRGRPARPHRDARAAPELAGHGRRLARAPRARAPSRHRAHRVCRWCSSEASSRARRPSPKRRSSRSCTPSWRASSWAASVEPRSSPNSRRAES